MNIRVAPTRVLHPGVGARPSRWYGLPYIARRRGVVILLAISLLLLLLHHNGLFVPSGTIGLSLSADGSAVQSSNQFTIRNKVAVIIESRPLPNLIALILHFSTVLGPSWPVILFTTADTAQTLTASSAPFIRAISAGQVAIFLLPRETTLDSHKAVSDFLTKPWFWEQLDPADNVLLFQSDSIICANAPQKVDDYLQYDLIGAPIKSGMGQGYNGGLSMRNRNLVLKIVRSRRWEDDWEAVRIKKEKQAQEAAQRDKEEKEKEVGKGKEASKEKDTSKDKGTVKEKEKSKQGGKTVPGDSKGKDSDARAYALVKRAADIFPGWSTEPYEDYEDQWFFKQMSDLPPRWNGKPAANLPVEAVARTFAVETIWYDKPLGYHQVGLLFKEKEHWEAVEKWCPEYKLCTERRFEGAG